MGIPLARLLARAVEDQAAHLIVDFEEVVYAGATAVARLIAGFARARGIQSGRLRAVEAETRAIDLVRDIRLLALVAEQAHAALRQYTDETRREQKRLDAHVAETRHRANRAVGEQGRSHEVAGEA